MITLIVGSSVALLWHLNSVMGQHEQTLTSFQKSAAGLYAKACDGPHKRSSRMDPDVVSYVPPCEILYKNVTMNVRMQAVDLTILYIYDNVPIVATMCTINSDCAYVIRLLLLSMSTKLVVYVFVIMLCAMCAVIYVVMKSSNHDNDADLQPVTKSHSPTRQPESSYNEFSVVKREKPGNDLHLL